MCLCVCVCVYMHVQCSTLIFLPVAIMRGERGVSCISLSPQRHNAFVIRFFNSFQHGGWRYGVQSTCAAPRLLFKGWSLLLLPLSDYVSDDPGGQSGQHMMDESGSASWQTHTHITYQSHVSRNREGNPLRWISSVSNASRLHLVVLIDIQSAQYGSVEMG